MNGHVDKLGRAIVTVSIRPSDAASNHDIKVWIDTGFNGDLVLPQYQIDDLELPLSGTLKAILADGSEVVLQRYVCIIDWFGKERDLEVVANDGNQPLLGVGMLRATIYTSVIEQWKLRSTERKSFPNFFPRFLN